MNYLTLAGTLSNAKRDDDGSVRGVLTFLFPQWDKGAQKEVLTPATLDVFLSQRVMLAVEATGKKIATAGMVGLFEGSFDITKQQGSPERYTFFVNSAIPLGAGVECHANTVIVAGNLGQDPDVKYFENGNATASITIATRKPVKDAAQPDWHTAKAGGKSAEFIAQYLQKGQTVSVKGSLVQESWTDKQTQAPRRKLVIRVDRINPLGKSERQDGQQQQYATAGRAGQPAPDEYDDDF